MEFNKILIWIFTIFVLLELSAAIDKSSKHRPNTPIKLAKGIKKPSLSAVRVGTMYDPCNRSSDCNEAWELYQCQLGYNTYECNCYYRFMYVASKGRSMCLGYTYLHGHCGFDEQCFDNNTYCSPGGTCECQPGFAVDEQGDCSFDYFWTGGKIAALSMGCVLAFFGLIGIIGFIVYECIGKPRQKEKNLS